MRRRVLIIDDEEDIREVAQISLESTTGWQILAASSGLEGLACAKAELPDAILLDLMMPGEDGLAVLARLKADAQTSSIPVILLTATVQSARRPITGAAGVILKPFDPLGLASTVTHFLGWDFAPAGSES